MKEIQAPNPFKNNIEGLSIFLAGSIEQNTAENWQQKLVERLSDYNVTLLNPRRSDWDSTWDADTSAISHEFRDQVSWELDALTGADIIVMYFDPATKSPISLLEFGRHIEGRKPIIVCCPNGYWRKGNIQVMCDRAGIKVLDNFDELVYNIKGVVELIQMSRQLGREAAKTLKSLFETPDQVEPERDGDIIIARFSEKKYD